MGLTAPISSGVSMFISSLPNSYPNYFGGYNAYEYTTPLIPFYNTYFIYNNVLFRIVGGAITYINKVGWAC